MTTGRLHRASLRTLAGMRVSTASRETRTAATPHVPGPLLERSTPAALVVAPAGQGLFTTDRTVRVKPSTWRLKSASRLTASASRWGVARHKGAPRDTSSSSSTPGLRRALGHHHRITTPALHSAPSRTANPLESPPVQRPRGLRARSHGISRGFNPLIAHKEIARLPTR